MSSKSMLDIDKMINSNFNIFECQKCGQTWRIRSKDGPIGIIHLSKWLAEIKEHVCGENKKNTG